MINTLNGLYGLNAIIAAFHLFENMWQYIYYVIMCIHFYSSYFYSVWVVFLLHNIFELCLWEKLCWENLRVQVENMSSVIGQI